MLPTESGRAVCRPTSARLLIPRMCLHDDDRTAGPPDLRRQYNADPEFLDRACAGYTAARIGLPRSGASLATAPLLDLKLRMPRPRCRA